MPEAVAEQSQRHRRDIRLVRFERGQVGDPRAGYAKRNEQERHDAAGGGQPRADQRARGDPVRPLRLVVFSEG